MFPLGSEDGPEPDIIGTAGADRVRPRRWRRYAVAGGVLVLAGIIAATSISALGRHGAVRRPGGASTGPSAPTPALAVPVPAEHAPPVPNAVPSQAWATSLNIANWPMPGSGTGPDSGMFAGGVAGNSGWELTVRELTVRDSARSGRQCAARLVLSGPDEHPSAAVYPLPSRVLAHTPVGDLAFIALGARSPGVGVGLLQLGAPAVRAWLDPRRIGGLDISMSVLTVRACGQRYYLAGFAYPLAGTLDVFMTRDDASSVHYLVSARLSRPSVPGVWQSGG